MKCVNCQKTFSVKSAAFCPFCGAASERPEPVRRKKSRGNGQGTVYKSGDKWVAQVVVGYRLPTKEGGQPIPVKRTKQFKTKAEAVAAIPSLRLVGSKRRRMTLEQIWKEWSESYEKRVGKSTFAGYKSAYMKLKPLHGTFMDLISITELQKCMDDCDTGIRTRQMLKTISGLLWKYAVNHNIIDTNITSSIYIGRGESVQREPLTPEEVEIIRKNIGKYRYAEYIYCLVFLGFRPGEMLDLKKEQLHHHIKKNEQGETIMDFWYLIAGKKTKAGKNRVVPVPPQILPLVLERLWIPGTDYLFPMYQFDKKNDRLIFMKRMLHSYLNKYVFKPITAALGIAEGKVPYCARHSYADMLKKADGTDKSKAAIIGHSDYLFTQYRYQSDTIEELARIASSLKN